MLSFGNALLLSSTLMVSGSTAIERVFSTLTYTGTGAARRLEGGTAQGNKGALHWIKRRNAAANHYLFDTLRGNNFLVSNTLDAQTPSAAVTDITDSGLNVVAGNTVQNGGGTMVMWSFVKSRKFFDVIEYTGNGVADRAIPHSLGVAPGMVIIRPYETSSNWYVGHRSVNGNLLLNQTSAATGNRSVRELNQNNFTVSEFSNVNGAGVKFIAYVFAHDPSTSGVIQCGAYTGGASSVPTIPLGWEPQWLLIKRSDGTSGWAIWDNKRSTTNPRNAILQTNSDAAESSASVTFLSNGFQPIGYSLSGANYVYMAIRKGAA